MITIFCGHVYKTLNQSRFPNWKAMRGRVVIVNGYILWIHPKNFIPDKSSTMLSRLYRPVSTCVSALRTGRSCTQPNLLARQVKSWATLIKGINVTFLFYYKIIWFFSNIIKFFGFFFIKLEGKSLQVTLPSPNCTLTT